MHGDWKLLILDPSEKGQRLSKELCSHWW